MIGWREVFSDSFETGVGVTINNKEILYLDWKSVPKTAREQHNKRKKGTEKFPQ